MNVWVKRLTLAAVWPLCYINAFLLLLAHRFPNLSAEEYLRQCLAGGRRKLLWLAALAVLALAPVAALWLWERLALRGGGQSLVLWVHVGLVLALGLGLLWSGAGVPLKRQWYEKYALVAHAGGGIDGADYTNSREAVEYNYQKGHRVFELDFCLSSDGKLVVEHDWRYYWSRQGIDREDPVTAQAFLKTRIWGRYTAMDVEAVIELMVQYDDLYVMTDYKDSDDRQLVQEGLGQIVDAARRLGAERVLDRIIIQLYHDEYMDWASEVYPFRNYVYTMYLRGAEDFAGFVDYCRRRRVPVATMWTSWYYDQVYGREEYGDLTVFVHTENDAGYIRQLVADGVRGIYTDFVTPDQLLYG